MRVPSSHSGCTLVEIDIILCPEQNSLRNRKAVQSHDPWPGGIIPFSFDKLPAHISSTGSKFKLDKAEAIDRIAGNFPVFPMLTFKEVPSAEANLHFVVPSDRTECSATLGHTSNAFVNLGASSHCWSDETILHELGHVAGLHHTQNRDDRDEYIHVPNTNTDTLYPSTLFFDFRSIMLYPLNILGATLTTKGRTRMELQHISENEVGRTDELSRLDLEMLHQEYGTTALAAVASNDDSVPYLRLLWVLAGMAVLIVAAVLVHCRKSKPATEKLLL